MFAWHVGDINYEKRTISYKSGLKYFIFTLFFVILYFISHITYSHLILINTRMHSDCLSVRNAYMCLKVAQISFSLFFFTENVLKGDTFNI